MKWLSRLLPLAVLGAALALPVAAQASPEIIQVDNGRYYYRGGPPPRWRGPPPRYYGPPPGYYRGPRYYAPPPVIYRAPPRPYYYAPRYVPPPPPGVGLYFGF